MKNLIMIAVFILAGIGTASAQAKMEFKSETIDYGTIKRGSDGVRVFEFTNTGDEPLVIEDVKSSCGCTIPKKPGNPILPGETGKIEVKYDTKRVGPIRKTVTVYSNTEEPTKALKIKGTVVEDEGSES
ncbi:DUF1573 domain-containing protein [Zunongwangia sp. F363]|uniref:DUF1573 domain-containing protein n=1 Tax=Autumnicola tepida TaxID=3075595 RepID=A0ABU3C819_9FLAO|nr:DUF1573 domain-containing protein [Zunongwangia sp. F363]MDT0642452.1 DUF1573 domain-containing protein [Zunongwangia sp. F363]